MQQRSQAAGKEEVKGPEGCGAVVSAGVLDGGRKPSESKASVQEGVSTTAWVTKDLPGDVSRPGGCGTNASAVILAGGRKPSEAEIMRPKGSGTAAQVEEDVPIPTASELVSNVRDRFGLGSELTRLLTVAASGCPVQDRLVGASKRVRGVFPLPFIANQRSPGQVERAGARRRVKGRSRQVSKTNFVIGLLNLLFGGLGCLGAALDLSPNAAQQAAIRTVHTTAAPWNFRADLAEAEALVHQPLSNYSVGSDLSESVDTDPALV